MKWRLYVYAFFSALALEQFLLIIYQTKMGYSLAQIGIGYAVFQAVYLLTELPSSFLADRFGRKLFLILGLLFKGITSLLWLLAGDGNMTVVLAANAMMALSITLASGTDMAYAHDLLSKEGQEQRIQEKMSRYMSVSTFGLTIGGLLGGVIALYSFKALFLTEAALVLVALVAATALPTLTQGSPSDQSKADLEVTRDSDGVAQKIRTAFQNEWSRVNVSWKHAGHLLLPLMIVALMHWTFSSLSGQMTEPLFAFHGLDTTTIAIIFTLSNLLTIAGTRWAGRLDDDVVQDRWLAVLPWLYAVASALRAVPPLALLSFGFISFEAAALLAGLGLMLGRFLSGMMGVILNVRLLSLAPDNLKATTLSSVDTMQALLMAAFFPLLGLVSEKSSLPVVFGIIAVIFVVEGIALLVWRGWRTKSVHDRQ